MCNKELKNHQKKEDIYTYIYRERERERERERIHIFGWSKYELNGMENIKIL